jgi:hypothetical protein
MKTTRLGLTLPLLGMLMAAHDASAACAEKRSRDPSFVELSVPENAIRPSSVADFNFVTDETTVEALVAKVGPPDASQGTRVTRLIWCFADLTEVWVDTRDQVAVESVRYKGKEIFRRGKPGK